MALTDRNPFGSQKQPKTMGGHTFWDNIVKSGRFRLQKHKFAPLFRILDDGDYLATVEPRVKAAMGKKFSVAASSADRGQQLYRSAVR